jgi:tetratricopeptide (TPR) repeat protein
MAVVPSPLPGFPLIGREAELALLRSSLDTSARGAGRMVILAGDSGTGKSRLSEAAAEEAERRGFLVARGRAYPMEAGVPYALFSDALLPVLRALTPQALEVMARGGTAELAHVFPTLLPGSARPAAAEDPAEVKTRVLWTMSQLTTGLSARAPLLLSLDDVHAADAASLELLHFLARQAGGSAVMIVCTYNESERRGAPALRALEQSLLSLGVATVQRVRPFDLAETRELLRRGFDVDGAVIQEFAALLFEWTGGNPFFVQETLRALVESGRLRHEDGAWRGWEIRRLEVPPTIREAVLARIDRLSAPARELADLLATIGTRADHQLVEELAGLPERALMAALDELRRGQVITEAESDAGVEYDFAHPMLRQAIYSELGRARARRLHGAIADALERRYGAGAADHAGELAYHFARSDARTLQAVRYLAAAGSAALDRFANREAVDYLALALERIGDAESRGEPPAAAGPGPANEERRRISILLARGRQRLGEYEPAIAAWELLLADAEAVGNPREVGAMQRGLGLAWYWSGRPDDALPHLTAGVESARAAGDARLEVRLRLAIANCLQELGRASEGAAEAEAARGIAERLGDASLLARAHRALLLIYTWTGPPDLAREHGARAVEAATATAEHDVLFSCHWALAVLEGLTGRVAVMADHIAAAERIAEQLRSPLFWLATAELRIEYWWCLGEWDRGIAAGERAIALARSLNQRALLTRLLVWTATIHLGRGEMARARGYVDEAWNLSGADDVDAGAPLDVHRVVPAFIGRAAYLLALGQHREAVRVGETGLALADRTGYVFWAIHRLLPIITESYCHLTDIEGALRCEARLRRDSQRLGHQLGMAWATPCAPSSRGSAATSGLRASC